MCAMQIAALIKPFGGRTVPRMLKSNIVREKFIPLRARLLELMEVRQPTNRSHIHVHNGAPAHRLQLLLRRGA